MTNDEKLELMAEIDPEMLLMPGYEDALIGVMTRCAQVPIAIYDVEKIIECLIREGLSYEEAAEHLSYNMEGGWVGKYTPGFLRQFDDEAHWP